MKDGDKFCYQGDEASDCRHQDERADEHGRDGGERRACCGRCMRISDHDHNVARKGEGA